MSDKPLTPRQRERLQRALALVADYASKQDYQRAEEVSEWCEHEMKALIPRPARHADDLDEIPF